MQVSVFESKLVTEKGSVGEQVGQYRTPRRRRVQTLSQTSPQHAVRSQLEAPSRAHPAVQEVPQSGQVGGGGPHRCPGASQHQRGGRTRRAMRFSAVLGEVLGTVRRDKGENALIQTLKTRTWHSHARQRSLTDSLRTQTCTHANTHARTHIHTHTHTRIHTHTHTLTHTTAVRATHQSQLAPC
jgi:hypothetical protein